LDYLSYSDYRGTAEYSAEDRCFHGKIVGIDDLVTYEGNTVDDLEQAFRDSVDDYLAFCNELGKQPEKAYAGKVLLRMRPELHRELATCADLEQKSLNAWLVAQLEHVARKRERRRA
jgi:predicted HicB family RNase H-like nuclease